MADEITLRVTQPGRPDDVLAAWRAQPPAWARDHGYEEIDASYNAVVFERRNTPRWAKLTGATIFSFGMWETVYRVTANMAADGVAGTAITLTGQADPKTRAAIAAQYTA